MPIRRTSPQGQFKNYLDKRIRFRIAALIQMFNYVGLECVREARMKRKYIDRTGNLRSSTGYCVLYNGIVVHQSGFEAVKPTAVEGVKEGKKLLNNLISSHTVGIVLIVVAGMDYACFVEAKGLNVLDTSEIKAKKLVKKTLKKLGFE